MKDLTGVQLWTLCILAIVCKLILCSFQYIYIAPNVSPIDDALMFQLAQNISDGNWLGEYNWLTLGKHSFFALWLAFLNKCHIGMVSGGQLLFAGACLTFTAAIKPAIKTNLSRFFIFGIVWFTPAIYAAYSLRVYRDNIYPALVLYLVGGLVGLFLRYGHRIREGAGFALVAGLAMGAAWLTHEDNLLLVPFIVCASLVYTGWVLAGAEPARAKCRRLGLLVAVFVLWAGCLGAWSAMNYRHYGRFIVSDFTSGEFSRAMGALSRACPDAQQPYDLVPYETRLKLYEVSPTLATIKPYLETETMYNGYGSVEQKYINSGGIHWAIRQAAQDAGYYETAQSSEAFYRAVASEVNAACDAGQIEAGGKRSGTFAPLKGSYLPAVAERFAEQVRILLLFEQTEPYPAFFIAEPEQIALWEGYLHSTSLKAAVANTSTPYFSRPARIAFALLNICTWVQRILVWPLLAASLFWLAGALKSMGTALKTKRLSAALLADILFFGVALTVLLRIGAVAYLMAVSFGIPGYLMYLSPACPLALAFLSCAAVLWLERRFLHMDGAADTAR